VIALLALLLLWDARQMAPAVHPLRRAVPAVRQDTYSYYLIAIDVTGTRRLTPQHVIALSGLKTGRTVQPRDIEAARARLADSGLLAKVGYRLRTTGGGYSLVVIFSVEELPWRAAVFFDNFVGFTDGALKQAVASAVPTFDGFVPETTAALERVRTALEKLVREAGQPGTVTCLLVDDKLLGLRRYRFHLDRQTGTLPVCGVAVSASDDALRDEMSARTAAIVGSDYSKDYIIRHAMQNLLPIARRAGYLQARVGEVEAAREPGGTAGCAGVRVSVAIDAGVQYLWQAATWNGNKLLASTDLDRLLGMTAGERADDDKIGRGIRAVTEAYRNKGHLDVAVQSQPVFDDARRQVACAIRIVEGDEFRMGKLDIAGLDPAVAERVKGLWQLAEGDVFDASYLSRFLPDARARLREALAPFKSVEVRTRRDSRALTIDVVVTFMAAAQTAAGPGPWFRDPAGSPP